MAAKRKNSRPAAKRKNSLFQRHRRAVRRPAPPPAVMGPLKVPMFVQVIASRLHGTEVNFLAKKTITATDLDNNQNRLLIPTKAVARNLLPSLIDVEKKAFGYDDGEEEEEEEEETNNFDGGKKGLKVTVHNKAGFWCSEMSLAYWSSSKACVLNGHDWRLMRLFSKYERGMEVELWTFRADGRGGGEGLMSDLNIIVAQCDSPDPDEDIDAGRI